MYVVEAKEFPLGNLIKALIVSCQDHKSLIICLHEMTCTNISDKQKDYIP